MTDPDPRLDYDTCFLSITAKPGVDAQDWAGMLCRQYRRFAERRQFELHHVFTRDVEHGIENATLEIRGGDCARLLAGEVGIHRLVRSSPFRIPPRPQSCFASVDCFPGLLDAKTAELDEADVNVVIDSGWCGMIGPDLGGPGYPIRVTHMPTRIVVESSGGTRTEIRDRAMRVLRAKVFSVLADCERPREMEESTGKKAIRRYVLTPYKMVRDERTKVQTEDVADVLDGGLDAFIEGYARMLHEG